MVVQKQKETLRYTKSWNIFMIGILAVIFVVWFGILIQKSENDILTLSSQMRSEAEQIRQKTHIRVQRNSTQKSVDTGEQKILTGTTNQTGSK